MAPPKKQKTVLETQTKAVEVQKTAQQEKLEKYFFRHKHAELYLKLLSTSLLDKVIGVQPEPYMKNILATVELELKDFLSQRYEELTGLSDNKNGFSKSEATALKLLANKITNKEPPPPPVQTQVLKELEVAEPEPEVSGVQQVVQDGVYASSGKTGPNGEKAVRINGPTDKMRRVKPKGVVPAPPVNSMQEMALASASAQHFNSQMSQMTGQLAPQMVNAPQDNNSVVNFDEPDFR